MNENMKENENEDEDEDEDNDDDDEDDDEDDDDDEKSANQIVETINSTGFVQHSTEDCARESGFISRGSSGLE